MKKHISLLLVCIMLTLLVSPMSVFAEYDTPPAADLQPAYHTGYLGVKEFIRNGVVSVKEDGKFYAGEHITREEAAKIIVLAAEIPLVTTTGTFTDVASGSWYEPYVETAYAKGLMNGISETKFGIGNKIPRQDAVLIIERIAGYLNIPIEKYKEVTVTDIDEVADYAKDTVIRLANMNVVEPDANGLFKPTNKINRFDFCKMINRVLISDVNYYDDYLTDWMPSQLNVEDVAGRELIVHEDFENGLTTLGGFFSRDAATGNATSYIADGAGMNGSKGIRISAATHATASRTSPRVNLILDNIDPTVEYLISYDIKATGITDPTYVRMNYQWLNAADEDIGGTYERINDLYEDYDWAEQVGLPSVASPDLAPKKLRLVLSLRESYGTTAEVMIDNVKIYKLIYEPINTYLKAPAYKGLITDPNGKSDIRLTTYVKGLGSIFDKNDCKVEVGISSLDGKKNYKKTVINNPAPELDTTFSSADLAIGDYDLYAKMIQKSTGKELGINHWVIRKRAEDFTSKYCFDEYGRLTKYGEPHFPIGTYSLGLYESDMEDFKDSAIDFFMANSTSSFWTNNYVFKKMREYGIESMLALDNSYTSAFRNSNQNREITNIASERLVLERMVDDLNLATEEAHIGYQINNEFPANKWASRITWQHQILSEIDFDHLTYGVGVGGRQAAIDYARCHDVYAQDCYPITGADTDEIWEVYEQTKGLVDGTVGRPAWAVLQVSDLKVMNREPYTSRERGPYEYELRNMAWQAVCAGAQGILWYAHFHLDDERPENEEDVVEGRYYVSRPKSETLPEMLRVSKEVDDYSEVILSREDAPKVNITSTNPSKFAHLVRRYNGQTYIFMVNMSKETQDLSMKLESVSSAHGQYSNSDYTISSAGKLSMSLEPLGVEILVLDQAERPSADCELNNVHLYDKNDTYTIAKDGDTNTVYIPNGVDKLNYSVDIHKDARVIVNGCPNSKAGTMSVEGKDKIRFTVISEDGQSFKQYWYNIIRY